MDRGHAAEVSRGTDSHPIHAGSSQQPTRRNVVDSNDHVASNVCQIGFLEVARNGLDTYSSREVGEEHYLSKVL